MYVSLYFPMSDFRDLKNNAFIRNPSWPIFREDANPFQQNLGLIRKRPRGGIRGWVQEGMICEIGRSIEIESKFKTRIRKRFYFDGSFSGYFSVGISGLIENKKIYHISDLVNLLENIFSLRIKSRHYEKDFLFDYYGKLSSTIYENGTSFQSKEKINNDFPSRFVMNSKPIVIIEMHREKLSSSIIQLYTPSIKFMRSQIRFISKKINSEYSFNNPIIIIEKKSRNDDILTREARMVIARLYCEFCLLQDSVYFLSYNESNNIHYNKKDYFCERISDSLSRLNGSKRISAVRNPDFYKSFTEIFLKGFDISKVESLSHALDTLGARRNLRNSLLKSHLWMNIKDDDTLNIVMENVMGSKYTNLGVVGAMGDKATNNSDEVSQTLHSYLSNQEISKLICELKSLKEALILDASTESLNAAAAISEAEDYAKRQDHANLYSSLEKAGKWAFEVATKIGVTVAAAAIKKTTGL